MGLRLETAGRSLLGGNGLTVGLVELLSDFIGNDALLSVLFERLENRLSALSID